MTCGAWQAFGPHNGKRACVYPIADLRPHEPDDERCWCKPQIIDGVLVHNSMDRREEYESGERQAS